MNLIKCPQCDINWIHADQEACPVCLQDTYKTQKNGKVAREPKPRPEGNIAFKCAYCDGGKTNINFGFAGTCSKENIKRNIEIKKQPCCCDADCPCTYFYKGKIKYEEIQEGKTCYESRMLIDWKALAGMDRKEGERKGKRREIKKNVKNGLCVLTTTIKDSRNTKNEERIVFGVFIVDNFFEGNEQSAEGFVQCNSKYKIKLNPDEANQILFWNYYYFPNKPELAKWKSGLYHFLDDYQCAQILRDIVAVKQGTTDEALANEILDYYCRLKKLDRNAIPENNGALTR